MSERHLAAGSAYPPLKGDTLRLYSMRYCPYAQRTRLVLSHLKVPHEVVNVNLKSKPDWFLAKTPVALVPILEQGSKVIYESAICDEYLEEVYGSHQLLPADPFLKARAKILMEGCSKLTEKFYPLLRLKAEEEKSAAVEAIEKVLKAFEDSLQGKYFGGDAPSMVDYHFWPFFERFPVAEHFASVQLLPAAQFPKLNAWVAAMHEVPAVQATRTSPKTHIEFYTPYLNGGTVNYDLEL
jgi:glutathione S-transferase